MTREEAKHVLATVLRGWEESRGLTGWDNLTPMDWDELNDILEPGGWRLDREEAEAVWALGYMFIATEGASSGDWGWEREEGCTWEGRAGDLIVYPEFPYGPDLVRL